MLMPWWPTELVTNENLSFEQSGEMMLLFCIGLFLPGCISSYLLDRYRRKSVCFWSIITLVAVSFASTLVLPTWLIATCRLLQGSAFALFHIALGSTILIDITVSERRDFASYIYYWFCRFALAVGPAIGVLALKPVLWQYIQYLPAVCAALAIYLIVRLELPFRTPLRTKVFSFDRFWLPGTFPLVLILSLVAITIGFEMSLNQQPLFYIYLLCGLAISLVAHFLVFYRSDIRAEIVTGLIALLAGFLLLLTQNNADIAIVASIFSGYGVGNVSGRMLSFFTAVSNHTERGSAQVTYHLTFEASLCFGFFLPNIIDCTTHEYFYLAALIMVALALLFYILFAHRWFLGHIKR